MDSKALAKSKRAHSLHHSKKHSSQKAKAKAISGGADNVASGNKTVGKQAKEKAQQSGLPSNWDRYEEEFDLGSEESSVDNGKATDVILPKSKGADYRHLIAEARSQCQSDSYLDKFPTLSDLLSGDCNFGLGPMLSIRGEGILSWIEDDNFVVEDETAASAEAQFLSLNLNTLAEQLAKVDISKRLFIEPDLLPPEMSGRGTEAASGLDSTTSKESEIKHDAEKNKVADQSSDVISSGTFDNSHSSSNSLCQEPHMITQTKGDNYSSRDPNSSQNRVMEPPADLIPSSDGDPKKKPLSFEATTAEAELDMLLGSFDEPKLLESSNVVLSQAKEASRALPQLSMNTPSPLKSIPSATELDDELDNLLEETSNLSNQNSSQQSVKVAAPSNEIHSSSSSQSVTKPKVLDDFDSWFDTL